MKILIPTIRSERVGTLVSYAQDRLYDCPNRPNVYGAAREVPLIERKLTTAVAFDRDLKLARRMTGVAQLALWTAVIPVAISLGTITVVGSILKDLSEGLAGRFGDLVDAAGIDRRGIRRTYAALAQKVIAQ